MLLTWPGNWYRTRKVNFEEDKGLIERDLDFPVLFIFATKDVVLTKELSAGMARDVPHLTRREVTAGHWALTEAADEVNDHIKEWLHTVVLGGQSKM